MTGDCGYCGLRVSGHWSRCGETQVMGSPVFKNGRNGEIERLGEDGKRN